MSQIFETIKKLKNYSSNNYIDDDFSSKKKPFWKKNPLVIEAKNLSKKIILTTEDIVLKKCLDE